MDCACVCVRACVTARARDSFFCCLIVDNLKIHTHTHTHTHTQIHTKNSNQANLRVAIDESRKTK